MRNIDLKCDIFFDVDITEYDKLSHFTFENLTIEAGNGAYDKSLVSDFSFDKVKINDQWVD
jgi:hypothetical protein